ncbi:hypothetical protein BGW36DRAFT_195665 [Talaromyces proteolyticus]|uniref:EF-hand domain-containing protein n=1 Tax=Talaromyces proteolyticus TaxID=1131652 RepID=A0AAD4PUE7_9EURO|nr:uncharacterized protein BGW36DRAFT_195665 [Talaromyces proteolyticus]KAH8695021.1 hypothetical protein BGW36DRAFT_195665 [Talaromyces proteolyticus]
MGWKKHPENRREQRDEQTRAFLKTLSSGQLNNFKITAACLEEICEKTPEDVYYSAEDIKWFIGFFLYADRNFDGSVSLSELTKTLESLEDKDSAKKDAKKAKEDAKELMDFFNTLDISGDAKLSLAEWIIIGFFGEDRKDNYRGAIRVELE